MIQRCSLYRDRKDGATIIASPRGSRSKITLYYQMMNSLKVTLHRIVTCFKFFPKVLIFHDVIIVCGGFCVAFEEVTIQCSVAFKEVTVRYSVAWVVLDKAQ